MSRVDLNSKLRSLLEEGDALVEEMLSTLEERYGEVPFVARMLSTRAEVFVPGFFKSQQLMEEGALEPRVAELVALASAVALRCPPCALSHMKRALARGASREEVLDAVLIAAHVAETSSLAVGLRKLLEAESAMEDCTPGCGVVRRGEE
ncbi:MAG: carboxymuconolactone decarboxylase family protein [Euryarchaeota archaeon]|nr:carboxymuconolactone decarboxylase family protein [Euryarchaeota archaeon]